MSERSSCSSATIYSIVETAKENGLNPFTYLTYLLERLLNVDMANPVTLDDLLAWSSQLAFQLSDACTGHPLIPSPLTYHAIYRAPRFHGGGSLNTLARCAQSDAYNSAYIELVTDAGVLISMDSRGRALDNVFTERLWRSLKDKEVYLHEYSSPREARDGVGRYLVFYNHQRPHQSLGYRTPAEVHFGKSEAMGSAEPAHADAREPIMQGRMA